MGSPPHRRGKVLATIGHNLNTGITPAWAGKSAKRHCTGSLWGDHPRVGGEKKRLTSLPLMHIGSPPRGRGKVQTITDHLLQQGITPAQAGKSSPAAGRGHCQDHPRVGGEKAFDQACTGVVEGSPPRRRGKGTGFVLDTGNVGITPAQAGKSLFCFTAAVPIQDHPRMGGEKPKEQRGDIVQQGSPPRRRGKGLNGLNGAASSRITPAWAGKRPGGIPSSMVVRDHPRVGGEKKLRIELSQPHAGSPPRGRGKVGHNQIAGAAHGITPA